MRFPWQRSQRPQEAAAEHAAEGARRHLERVKAETPKYRALAHSLIEIQRANHLGEAAAKVLRGDHK